MAANAALIYSPDTPDEQRIPLYDQVSIGRRTAGESIAPDHLAIPDASISRRHCVVTRQASGQMFVRDVSRNGTRLNRRRLLPNVETEVRSGDLIEVGSHSVRVWAEGAIADEGHTGDFEATDEDSTEGESDEREVAILVGRIHYPDQTETMTVDVSRLVQAVSRVIPRLESVVSWHGGSFKEHQTDGIFAFWSATLDAPIAHVESACTAVLALQDRVTQLAADTQLWDV